MPFFGQTNLKGGNIIGREGNKTKFILSNEGESGKTGSLLYGPGALPIHFKISGFSRKRGGLLSGPINWRWLSNMYCSKKEGLRKHKDIRHRVGSQSLIGDHGKSND